MVPLFERGREALRQYVLTLRPGDRPALAQQMEVVTYEDFVKETELVFRHCVHNGATVHVLCESGALCLLLEKLHPHF